jgi:hypothetical protein
MGKEATINDVLEVVEFLKNNVVTKDEFHSTLSSVVAKDEFHATLLETKSEILNHVDGFVVLHQKLDTELAALRSKYDRLEGFVKQLANHADITLEF